MQKAVGYENIYRAIRGFNARQGKLHGFKNKKKENILRDIKVKVSQQAIIQIKL